MINFVEFHTKNGYWKSGIYGNNKLFSLVGFINEPFIIRKPKSKNFNTLGLIIAYMKS